jgi:hypothetical protein
MNELNLYDLFEQIISKSKTMKRFVIAPGCGNDLNKNNLGEILTDALGGITDGVKSPIAFMLPPMDIPNSKTGWSRFKCKIYFLSLKSNEIQNTNRNNNLSTKEIKLIWNEMRKSAIDFRKVFCGITGKNLSKGIRDGQEIDFIERVSNQGNDKYAGVGISFDVDVLTDCAISDYTEENINSIEY